MFRFLSEIDIQNHEILGNLHINLINPNTNKPYSIVVFVGENGCGKTTLLTKLSETPEHHFVFLRQNSMFVGLSNESYKLICGKDNLYPIQNNEDLRGGMNVYSLRTNNVANNTAACIELLKSLNDESLIEIYKSGKLDNSRCGGEATRIIDGKKDFFDLNTLSSGQQEILLKLKTLKQAQAATDFVLLDEPETSLHPRWQKRIVYLIRDIIADKATSVNMPYVIERWPGGMLTNFPTIRKAVKKMANIDKLMQDGTFSNLSKRELLQITRQRAKLEKNLGSIADLTRLPSALFVVDVLKEQIAVREANRLGIPVFGIVDTNSDPNNIDFVIPANDDAKDSVEAILTACCNAINEGLEERKVEKADEKAADAQAEADAEEAKPKRAARKPRKEVAEEEAPKAEEAAPAKGRYQEASRYDRCRSC